MARLPILIGVVAVVSAVVGAASLAVQPGAFDAGATIVVLAGMVLAAVSAFVGLVLVRAPWGRWSLLSTVIVGLLLASLVGGWLFFLDLLLAAIATVGIAGPWLLLWVRHAPVADAPNPAVVTLISVGPVTPLFVGLTALGGLSGAHVVLIVVVMLSSWGYGRGIRLGIWGLRIAVPVVGIVATGATVWPGTLPLGAAVLATTLVAWLPDARRATTVITPPLPAPVVRNHRRADDASE
ncbi:hypothetical protein MNBD_ACTINO01-1592 [hydrothermal vent metagenome]|uniref:Uncharacterized protein n=1 Tax=hydrothermal vent metagenome TaxID=652676 RepID=A0A3B0T2X7_9ZZZZ